MAKRRFTVSMVVELEVDEQVFADVLTDGWRAHHYAFHTPEEVAGHLAFNLVRGDPLSSLDGFADQPDDRARCGPLEVEDVAELSEPGRPSSQRAPRRLS